MTKLTDWWCKHSLDGQFQATDVMLQNMIPHVLEKNRISNLHFVKWVKKSYKNIYLRHRRTNATLSKDPALCYWTKIWEDLQFASVSLYEILTYTTGLCSHLLNIVRLGAKLLLCTFGSLMLLFSLGEEEAKALPLIVYHVNTSGEPRDLSLEENVLLYFLFLQGFVSSFNSMEI